MARAIGHRPPQRALAAAAVLAMALVPGCGVKGLSFRQDDRVTIVSPVNHSTQPLPVVVRWATKGFNVTGPDGRSAPDAGYFAVLLDQTPQPPGEPIDWLARADPTCHRLQGCPDATWFTEHNIFPTTATSLTVDSLPTLTKEERQRFHDVTVVLLDGRGRRIGEVASWVEFKVRAGGA